MAYTGYDTSFPSTPVTIADVPEIRRFTGKFMYNFFIADESINDVGEIFPEDADVAASKFTRHAPRFVSFNFVPINLQHDQKSGNMFRSQTNADDLDAISIAENFNKIRFEHELTTTSYTGVRFQDSNIDDKLFLITSGSVARSIRNHNNSVIDAFSGLRGASKFVDSKLRSSHLNLFDVAKLMTINEGPHDAKLIVDALNNIAELNTQFIDDDAHRDMLKSTFERVKNVGLDVQFNTKFVFTALNNIVTDPVGLYADEVAPVLQHAYDIQASAVAHSRPDIIDESEYEPFAEPVSTRAVNVSSFNTRKSIVGYVIDKQEVFADGRIVDHKSIIIENSRASTAFDTNVAYGHRYRYSMRAIFAVEFAASVQGHDDIVAATLLISSKPSTHVIIDCIETIPPPPPTDFSVDWDRKMRVARLTWSMPPNRQRDIKRYQVFRRSSIYEPFMLIHEYDFDDSSVKHDNGETPDKMHVTHAKSPVNMHIDSSFTRASEYIYAVCSIDAHGMTSGYSMQVHASFDSMTNKIVKKRVSVSGAPKQYPNAYVRQDDVIVDVMKDSHHSQVDIYFDPEFLDIVDAAGRDMHHMSTRQTGGTYRLQFMNTDLQQSGHVDITIDDRRTDVKKLIENKLKKYRRPSQH